MKQKFKGDIITKRKAVNSILRFFHLAIASEVIDGMKWYSDAKDYGKELSARYNISLQTVVGIIAVFSPQTTWEQNKRFALSFLINPNRYNKNQMQDGKAKKILSLKNEDEIYQSLSVNDKAFKTKAFFLNILNPDIVTSVTIDRHAIAICTQKPSNTFALSDDYGKLTKGQYNFFESCYVAAAKKLDILPQQLQAITWLVYRRLRELPKHNDLKGWQPFETDVTF